MFLCAPPFIRNFSSSSVASYEVTITIGTLGPQVYGYYSDASYNYGSIDNHGDVFGAIYAQNASDKWFIGVRSSSPVLPVTGSSYHFDTYIVSGASSTGVYLPDGASGITSAYYYIEDKTSTINMNTSGTATFIIEFVPA